MTERQYRTIVVVDVVGFTAPDRRPPDRLAVHQGMYEVLKKAFADCGIDFGSCDDEDRGDGALILLPSGTGQSVVADRLPERVVVELRRYNSTRIPQAQILLRMGLNSGTVQYDGKGWVGEAIDTSFRILDEQEIKKRFAESGRMVAVIASQGFFGDVIAPDPGLLPESYVPIPVSVKTFTGTAYLRLHGELAAPTPQPPALPPGSAADQASDLAKGDVLELVSAMDAEKLRPYLTRLKVPQLAVTVSRALGRAIPLPPLDDVIDAWDAFELLSDFNAGPDGIPPAVTFLYLLAEQFDGKVGDALAGWVGDQAQRLRIGPALSAQRQIRPPVPDKAHLHLTILLEPVCADPDRCTLVFWRQDDPAVWPPALGDVREVGIDELELRVDDVIMETEAVWSGQSVSAAVEFLLPRNLITLPVQRWAKEHVTGQPQPLRYGYRLGVRPLERMRAKYWHRAWNRRWVSMLEDPSADRLHYSGCEEQDINAELSNDRWIGLVLTKPPSPQPEPGTRPDEYTAALSYGLPVLLWHPHASPEELRELLDWVLATERGFMELPDRRKMANSNTALPFKNSLAHDLVVMWDDPKRTIVLDQPLIPTLIPPRQ
ncbi:VMAP-C domain-containing protein [Amycolatopsis samaneae]|uniref:Guanylate cyclase domain-containing protein n=1 Tax=Amycolatopsis samaneae TaxID=664691 RepID=A0ABW5GMH6_9PSEU